MILATHELVGAAIGVKIHSPWLIILFSLTMHFVLDTFRHGEYVEGFDKKITFKNTWWKIAVDLSMGIIIIFLYIYFKDPNPTTIWHIFLGAFASIFPDSLTFLYWRFRSPYLKKIYKFHSWCHKYPPGAPERAWTLRNATNDIIISLPAIIILFIK